MTTQAQIAILDEHEEETIHAMFLRDFGHLLQRPELLTHEQFLTGPAAGAWREWLDLTVQASFHIEASFSSYDEFEGVVYDIVIRELRSHSYLCDSTIFENLTKNPERVYYYRFFDRKAALAFVNELAMAGDDSV